MQWILGLVVVLSLQPWRQLCAQNSRVRPQRIVVALQAVPDDRPAPFFSGLSNIFFEPLSGALRDSVKMESAWLNAEIADVVDLPSLKKARALRFRTATDSVIRYRLDTAGSLDFTRATSLTFDTVSDMMVASAPYRIRARSGAEAQVPLQIIDAGKYTYARIAEARTGQVSVAGQSYAVRVQPRNRNNPFYTTGAGTLFLIDFDRDGSLSQRAARLVGGRPVAAEEVKADAPFELGGVSYDIESIDSVGSRLTLRRSTRKVAVSPGFRPPPFTARDMNGTSVDVSKLAGQPTLLEFWSIECPFSEAVREPLNALMLRQQRRFTWISMSRETAAASVSPFLLGKPRSARVVLGDSVTWAAYNPASVTPLFVVLDKRGVVAFVASGATALPAVSAKLEELLGAKGR